MPEPIACAGKSIIAVIFDRRRRPLQNQLPEYLENGLSKSHQTYRDGRPVGSLHSTGYDVTSYFRSASRPPFFKMQILVYLLNGWMNRRNTLHDC